MDRYADALARCLPAVLGPEWRVARLADPGYPAWSRYAARWLAYPRVVPWERWDVVHILDHSYAHILHRRRGSGRTVVTVHDLLAFDYRDPGQRAFRGRVLQRINGWVLDGINCAHACLCDSRATLRAVSSHLPAVAPRARHQPLGVEQAFFVTDRTLSRAAGRYALGIRDEDVVVLHVGSCAPRKGLHVLLEAFDRIRRRDPRLLLVQVGGRFTPRHLAFMQQSGMTSRVRQHDFVADSRLPSVYAAADVVVMPSLFEGFGLPVLEAFAVGVPVVSTRAAALAEFPANLLFPVEAGDSDALAEGIQDALGSSEAERRVSEARIWAADFSWARVARGTAQAYLN
jgi:glycosyltransferase involved in cell wall biosynthesis